MESEQSQNFNERLSQWVANQAFWFQVRYSLSSSGTTGTAMFHVLRLTFRLLVFVLIVAAGCGVYLLKRTESKKFNDGLKAELKEGLSASEIELNGFSRVQGQLDINGLACKGAEDTFYSTLRARNIHCKMGFLDGIAGKWDPGTVSLSRLEMELRAGTDDAQSAAELSKTLFKKFDNVNLTNFEIADASFRWGYRRAITATTMSQPLSSNYPQTGYDHEHTRGEIANSYLKVQRNEDGYKLTFKGGTFSQNWLKSLEISELVVVCDPNGVVFEKALFRKGQGTVDLTGMKVTGGERPVITGMAKIQHLALSSIIPPALRTFVEGTISGNFTVSGSTNSSDGISFEGDVTLDGKDNISLRERIHLLRALSVVDYSRNYHRIDFTSGSFHMKSGGGGIDITQLSLKADELFTMDGKLRIRLPTPEEIRAAVSTGEAQGGAHEDEIDSEMDDPNFTLKRAALEVQRQKEAKEEEATLPTLYQSLGLDMKIRSLEAQSLERLSRVLRYEGLFVITLPPDAFERGGKLKQQFPVDSKLGRIPMRVPLEGTLYDLTFKQAEDIYQQGRL